MNELIGKAVGKFLYQLSILLLLFIIAYNSSIPSHITPPDATTITMYTISIISLGTGFIGVFISTFCFKK